MSIKDNIKDELIRRIKNKITTLTLLRNQDSELMRDSWHSGHLQAIEEELTFLENLIEFIKTI